MGGLFYFRPMERILVTGSNGFLGMKLTEKIVTDKNFALTATGKGADRYPQKTGYDYAAMDITDKNSIRTVIEKHRPKTIIHTAAISHVDVCENDPALAGQINVEATGNLTEIAGKMGIHCIYVSTDFVFDGKNGPYDESAETNPVNEYGRTKLAAEKIVAKMSSSAIVRTILVYGQPIDASRSNIILWAKKELEAGRTIKVASDHWRMPTLVEDLAEACIRIAQRKAKGIFHISGDEGLTMYELVKRAAAFWQLDVDLIEPVPSSYFKQTAIRPVRTGFYLDKARRELHYNPHTLEEGFTLMQRQQNAIK